MSREQFGAFALFVVLAVGGAFAAYAAVRDYAHARASRAWPVVHGVILSGEAESGGVRYAWFDGEVSHSGSRIRFGSAGLAQAKGDFQPGEKIEVHVSPDDGSVAVLQPGGSARLFAALLTASAILVFVGLAGVIRLAMTIDGLAVSMRAMEPAE